MHKGLIVFIVVAGISLLSAVILFMKKTADQANRAQDKILQQFKTVDESLKKSNAYIIDSANKKLLDSITAKQDK